MGHNRREMAWLEPWQNAQGCLALDSSAEVGGERSHEAGSTDELIEHVREVNERVHRWCGYWVAVSLGGLGEPALYAAAINDRWHFWYLAEGGAVSLRSLGDEAALGTNWVIFSEFDEVPCAESVPDTAGEQVVRTWVDSGLLSDVIQWRSF